MPAEGDKNTFLSWLTVNMMFQYFSSASGTIKMKIDRRF